MGILVSDCELDNTKKMAWKLLIALFALAHTVTSQIPSSTRNQGCPIVQPKPKSQCPPGHSAVLPPLPIPSSRPARHCWSPGVEDTDCPDGKGRYSLCCYDGCDNVCERQEMILNA